ncbi:MAG: cytochrome c family protein [Thermodesulfobacteriota bacterium]
MKKIVLGCVALLFFGVNAQAEEQEFGFEGVKSCKKCHRKVWKSWKETPMAQSFEILKPGQRVEIKKQAGLDPNKDYTTDETCLPCHTTGYTKKGGFVSPEKTPYLVGVACEACHGAGEKYNKVMAKHSRTYTEEEVVHAGLILDPKTTCLSCHNDKSPTRKFQEDFDPADHDWPGHDPVKLKYHTPEYQVNKL